MDPTIQREILLITEIDNQKGTEAIKILSICAHVIDCNEYTLEVAQQLNTIFNQPDFNLFTEIGQVAMSLIKLNRRAKYYKDISIERMKYVLYSTLYHYMSKNQLSFFNSLDIGQFRILFSNSWELISVMPDLVQIAKRGFLSCFSCCSGNDIKIQ
ncbi:MAG: hypothetical protein ABWZ79_05865 [Pedobacter agri]